MQYKAASYVRFQSWVNHAAFKDLLAYVYEHQTCASISALSCLLIFIWPWSVFPWSCQALYLLILITSYVLCLVGCLHQLPVPCSGIIPSISLGLWPKLVYNTYDQVQPISLCHSTMAYKCIQPRIFIPFHWIKAQYVTTIMTVYICVVPLAYCECVSGKHSMSCTYTQSLGKDACWAIQLLYIQAIKWGLRANVIFFKKIILLL